jgi:hypothetical protein
VQQKHVALILFAMRPHHHFANSFVKPIAHDAIPTPRWPSRVSIIGALASGVCTLKRVREVQAPSSNCCSSFHHAPCLGPHKCPPPLGEETGKSPRHGNGRLCCTTTPRSSHTSRRQLVYIKEKNTSFCESKIKKIR